MVFSDKKLDLVMYFKEIKLENVQYFRMKKSGKTKK